MTTPADRMYAHRVGYHKPPGQRDPLCLLCHLQDKDVKGTVTAPRSLLREGGDRLGLPRDPLDLRDAGLVRQDDSYPKKVKADEGSMPHPSQDQIEYDR